MNTAVQSHSATIRPSVPSIFLITAWLQQNLMWVPGRLILNFFLKLKVNGVDHVREAVRRAKSEGKGVLLVSNHTDMLDPIVILAGLYPFSPLYPMTYVVRPPSFYAEKSYFGGWRSMLFSSSLFFKSWGAFALTAGTKDYATSLQVHEQLLQQGHSVSFFPEGTMSRDSFRGEAKGGAGYLALKTKCIVLPVFIDGLWQLRGTGDFWNRRRTATLSYGTPFTVSELSIVPSETENLFKDVSNALLDRIYNLQSK